MKLQKVGLCATICQLAYQVSPEPLALLAEAWMAVLPL